MVGKMEGSDDVALDFRIEIGAETEFSHSPDQQIMVVSVTRAARQDASFLLQLLERLREGKNRMSGWRVAKLAVFFKALELPEQVEAETSRVTLAGHQGVAPADHKGESGHTLDALVRRGNQEVNAGPCDVNGYRAETAHGTDDIAATVSLDDSARLFDRIEDAGGGLAMNQGYVRDGFIRRQGLVQRARVVRDVF